MEAEDEPTSTPGFTSRPDAHNGVSGSHTAAVVERERSAVFASAFSTLLIALRAASVTFPVSPLYPSIFFSLYSCIHVACLFLTGEWREKKQMKSPRGKSQLDGK